MVHNKLQFGRTMRARLIIEDIDGNNTEAQLVVEAVDIAHQFGQVETVDGRRIPIVDSSARITITARMDVMRMANPAESMAVIREAQRKFRRAPE